MSDNLTPPPPPGSTTEEFINNQGNPSIESKEAEAAANQQPAATQPGRMPPPPPPPAYAPPPGGEKVFETDDTTTEEGAASTGKKTSTDYKHKVLMGLIVAEDHLTAQVCALVADEDDADQFKSDESDKETLVTLMEPFEDWIIDKCPAILPFMVVYGAMKTQQFAAVRRIYKEKEKRAAHAKKTATNTDGGNMQRPSDQPASGTRKNFKLNKKGTHYYNTREGHYATMEDVKETPSIDDIASIAACISNTAELIHKAFPELQLDYIQRLVDEHQQ